MDKPSYNRHFTSYYDDYDYDRDQDRRRGDRQIGEEGNDTGHAGSLRAAAPAGIGTIRFGASHFTMRYYYSSFPFGLTGGPL